MVNIKYLYNIMAFSLAMMALISSVPITNSLLVFFTLTFSVCSFLLLYFGFSNLTNNIFNSKLLLLLIIYITTLSIFKFVLFNNLYVLLSSLLSLMICVSLLIVIDDEHKVNFFGLFVKLTFLCGILLLFLMLVFGKLGQGGFVLENAPASFMVPYAFYYSLKGRDSRKKILIIGGVLMVSVILESRTSQVLMLSLCSFELLKIFGHERLYSFLNYAFVLIAGSIFLIAYNNESLFYYFNEVLTNRPMIWSFYISGIDNSLFGSSVSYKEMSSLVAVHLSGELERGVAEHYGTHSSIVKYYYDFGLIGLFLFFSLSLYLVFKYSHSIFTTYFLSVILLTSTMIGQPNLFGIMLVFIFLGIFNYDDKDKDELY